MQNGTSIAVIPTRTWFLELPLMDLSKLIEDWNHKKNQPKHNSMRRNFYKTIQSNYIKTINKNMILKVYI